MQLAVIPAVLSTADRGYMLGALASFANKPINQWLPNAHPAASGQIPRKWADVKNLPSSQIIEAVAASAPNHCIDGWSYASRGLSALLAGDAHAARHLAYYAQLRAALSILANLGIGVFNRINFAIQSNGSVLRLDTYQPGKPNSPGMGTHDVVWEVLRDWANGTNTSKVFLDLVKIRGSSLRDCLEAIWPGFPSSGAAITLIEAWGVDLRRGRDEHRYRNVSSYSPHTMNPLNQVAIDSLRFVRSFWSLFEPTGGSGFDNLDRFMLRALLLKQHRVVYNNLNYSTGAIASRYSELPPGIRALASVGFLTNTLQPRGPEMLQRASDTGSPARPTEMLGRAFLLLRAATAFTQSSLLEAGLDCAAGDLRPWIDEWASSRGFWTPTSPLADPTDLWADVELALMEFDRSIDPPPQSLGAWLQNTSKGMPTIFEAERVAVWTLGA